MFIQLATMNSSDSTPIGFKFFIVIMTILFIIAIVLESIFHQRSNIASLIKTVSGIDNLLRYD